MLTYIFAGLALFVSLSSAQGPCTCEPCNEVCYPPYGCYNQCPPFDDFPLPESPEQIDTQFRLYTRDNIGIFEWEELIIGSIASSRFDGGRPTQFIVHGFSQSGFSGWVTDMFEAILAEGDYNTIVVDWSAGANLGIANRPASNSRVVGAIMAEMAQALADEGGMSFDDLRCIGFSLGAHTCGFFGKNSPTLPAGISGLDPTGDVFNHDDEIGRLAPGDAVLVDIIHTNAFGLIPSGTDRDIGDVDFWANGGRDQPGCLLLGEICDHGRAHEYYRATVEGQCTYRPEPCDSFEQMQADECQQCNDCNSVGWLARPTSSTGTYWFDVTRNYPHCANE